MGRSFGFTDAYAKRDRALNAQAKAEKVWYADGSDGDPRAGAARDPWVVNEDAARQQAIADAPALEKLAERANVRRFTDSRGRTQEFKQDISPGLHGQDVTIYGERATFELPEPEIKGGRPTAEAQKAEADAAQAAKEQAAGGSAAAAEQPVTEQAVVEEKPAVEEVSA